MMRRVLCARILASAALCALTLAAAACSGNPPAAFSRQPIDPATPEQATLAAPASTIHAPDVTVPDVTVPDVTVPDVTVPDGDVPDGGMCQKGMCRKGDVPDVTASDGDVPDVTASDGDVPDVTASDGDVPDVTVPVAAHHVADMSWGTFRLAGATNRRLAAGDSLTFALVAAQSGTDRSDALEAGWLRGARDASASLGVDVRAVVAVPDPGDEWAQADEIVSLAFSGEVDCLAVDPGEPAKLVGVVDAVVAEGLPVFTVGRDVPQSRRFAFYGLDNLAAGRQTGTAVGRWVLDSGLRMRWAAVLTADADDPAHLDRIQGFTDALTDTVPGLVFINGPGRAASTGAGPQAVRTHFEQWLDQNPPVDLIFHTDDGLETVSQVLAERYLHGEIYTVGFHISETVADLIHQGVVAAAVVQGTAGHAHLAATACARYLASGDRDTGAVLQPPALIVTEANLRDHHWAAFEDL